MRGQKSNVTTFLTKKTAFVVSVHFELSLRSSVCILDLDRILDSIYSLHFVPSLQSAFCTDRMIGFYYEVARERKFFQKNEFKGSPLILQLVEEHRKGHVSHTTTTYANVKTANRVLLNLFLSEINTLLS